MAFNAADDLIRGKDYQIWISSTSAFSADTIIAYGTSCSVSIDADTVEASSKFSCGWKAADAGTAGYTVQSDSLYTEVRGATSFSTLMDLMLSSAPAYWRMGKETSASTCSANTHTLDTTEVYFSGRGIPTSLSLEAASDSFVECSCTITGTGPIEIHRPNG